MLLAFYCNLVARARTLSGKSNNYNIIVYQFPAAVPLVTKSAISEAFICRTKWTILSIIKEKNILLGKNQAVANKQIDKQHSNISSKLADIQKLLEKTEQKEFKKILYFLNKKRDSFGNIEKEENENPKKSNKAKIKEQKMLGSLKPKIYSGDSEFKNNNNTKIEIEQCLRTDVQREKQI